MRLRLAASPLPATPRRSSPDPRPTNSASTARPPSDARRRAGTSLRQRSGLSSLANQIVAIRLRQRPQLHLVQTLAARHHRVHVLVGLDVEVRDDRALVGQHFLNGLLDVALVVAADAADAAG